MNFTLMLVAGSYGGFYVTPTRICLGWLALSFIPVDIEEHLHSLMEHEENCECQPPLCVED